MDVEIMYADKTESGAFRQVRVPLRRVCDLEPRGVLFIIISKPTTEQMGRRVISGTPFRRADEIYGNDTFALVTYVDGGSRLWGWDDGSFRWTPGGDPTSRGVESVHIFRGLCLAVEEWKVALDQFNRKMH